MPGGPEAALIQPTCLVQVPGPQRALARPQGQAQPPGLGEGESAPQAHLQRGASSSQQTGHPQTGRRRCGTVLASSWLPPLLFSGQSSAGHLPPCVRMFLCPGHPLLLSRGLSVSVSLHLSVSVLQTQTRETNMIERSRKKKKRKVGCQNHRVTLGKSLYLRVPQGVKRWASGAQREGPFCIHSQFSLTPLRATINQVVPRSKKRATLAWTPFW